MFKTNSTTEMNHKHFGVGSTFEAAGVKYLVIKYDAEYACVINMKTMNLVTDLTGVQLIRVVDLNYFTKEEASDVIQIAGDLLQITFSDFTLDPKGLKP